MKARKLDIFRTLNHISKKDKDFYTELSDDEQKGYLPFVIQRWLSGTSNAAQIFYLNELVNPYVFPCQKHKQLLHQLMTICTSGKTQKYFWNKTASKKTTSIPEVIKVIKQYYDYNTIQALEVVSMLSDDDILLYAEHLGRQKEEITKIKRELKQRSKLNE